MILVGDGEERYVAGMVSRFEQRGDRGRFTLYQLKAGGGFIMVGPAGVTISGTPLLINGDGTPGVGSGASPDAPQAPQEADTAEPGGKDRGYDAEPVPFAEIPPAPATFRQIHLLRDAAQSGAAICEQCATEPEVRDHGSSS